MTKHVTRRAVVTGLSGLAVGAATLSGPTAARQATPDASPAAATPPATRTVEHARGTTAIPTDPQRVMALGEEFLLADLLTLGVPVVASTATVAAEGFGGLDGFDTEGIAVLDATEPDLERLVAVGPDLIVTNTFVWDQVGNDLLSAIAPTVVVEEHDDGWRATFLSLGAFLEREDAADEALADYDAAVSAARSELATEGRTVSIATIYPGAALAVWIDGPANIPQTVLDLGFTLEPGPGSVPDADDGRAFLSIEQLQVLTGDDLIMLQSSAVEGEDEAYQETLAEPIWQTLPAVQADRVSVIDRLGYPGIAGRQRLIADLVDALDRGA